MTSFFLKKVNCVKSKFHDAIQVADLVADPVSEKFVLVCDQLATFWVPNSITLCMQVKDLVADLGFGPVADRFELSRHVEIARTWSHTGSKLAFDRLSTSLRPG